MSRPARWSDWYGRSCTWSRSLPPRVVVFGISSLPMQAVQALAALGRFSQVLMVVQNPCRYYWGHVVDGRAGLSARTRQKTKLGLPVQALPLDLAGLHAQAHPLLASWGKQGRDYLHMLDGFDQPETYAQVLQKIEVFDRWFKRIRAPRPDHVTIIQHVRSQAAEFVESQRISGHTTHEHLEPTNPGESYEHPFIID